jgi:hypothetical protein
LNIGSQASGCRAATPQYRCDERRNALLLLPPAAPRTKGVIRRG